MASTEYQAPAEKEISADANGGNPPVQRYDYGGNPLYHAHTGNDARLAAFGGEFQPGLYKPTEHRKFANPAPLGLSAFALTTFVLSLVNLQTRGVKTPNIAVSLAFGYGGLVQLLAGMWEMAVANTFGATALSSYGGFWIAYAIILTPSFNIVGSYAGNEKDVASVLGFFLTGWFIFTTILLLLTLRSTSCSSRCSSRSTWPSCSWPSPSSSRPTATWPPASLSRKQAACSACSPLSSLGTMPLLQLLLHHRPVFHFPWSEKARESRTKTPRETA
ncbi:hypothetical protein NUW58_g9007 [Xylaria curta]|uniref:Uncharacterized protein n=1 Tax=Xylaria curta TaxID=42375 RepID=A0ACC1N3Z6_9PEZI|nr:hypothetical protein NUW58_g9007 [Xylaria curta]